MKNKAAMLLDLMDVMGAEELIIELSLCLSDDEVIDIYNFINRMHDLNMEEA